MSMKNTSADSVRMSNALRALLVLAGALCLVGLAYLGQNGQATLTGRQVQDLQTQLERIERENAELENENAQYTLPSQVADRAKAMGFRPATISQTVFVVVKNFPPTETPAPSNAAGSQTGSGWWDELLGWLGLASSGTTGR